MSTYRCRIDATESVILRLNGYVEAQFDQIMRAMTPTQLDALIDSLPLKPKGYQRKAQVGAALVANFGGISPEVVEGYEPQPPAPTKPGMVFDSAKSPELRQTMPEFGWFRDEVGQIRDSWNGMLMPPSHYGYNSITPGMGDRLPAWYAEQKHLTTEQVQAAEAHRQTFREKTTEEKIREDLAKAAAEREKIKAEEAVAATQAATETEGT